MAGAIIGPGGQRIRKIRNDSKVKKRSIIHAQIRTFVWSIVDPERLISISSLSTFKFEDLTYLYRL